MIPIKTNDIVDVGGKQHLVRGIQLTAGGPLLELSLLSTEKHVVHIDEVMLVDSREATYRAKAAGITLEQTVELPQGMSPALARRVLQTYAARQGNKG